MKVKKIVIKNKQRNKLVGLLNIGTNEDIIIICNGYDTTKEFAPIKLLAKGLNKAGYHVFRFDFSGTGESEGIKKVFLSQQADDLNSVVDYFTDYKKIILLGGSLGAL